MPVLATYFSVRRGRDPFFKFFMRTIFPRQVREYEQKFGIKFIGWYNVAYGWDFDNVILMDLPDYATIDKLEKDKIPAYEMADLRKIAFWNATGSGKTLLMHVNILQYQHYLDLHGQELDPHVDFNFQLRGGFHRRANLLLYLNEDWDPSWGGALEIH